MNPSWFAAQHRARLSLIILFTLVLAVFGRVVNYEFVVWDDELHVVDNPQLDRPASFWTAPYQRLYIPLSYTVWSGLADMARVSDGAGGTSLNPAIFHLANLILHLGSVLLVFVILRSIGASVAVAFWATAIFAVHPLQVETVAWVSGLRDGLGGLLSLATIAVAVRLGLGSWRAIALIALAYWSAMLAKPGSVGALPMAGVLWLYQQKPWATESPRVPWKKNLILLAILMVPAMALLVWTRQEQSDAALMVHNPVSFRPIVAADALAFYFRKLIVPYPLAIDYGRTPAWLLQSTDRFWTWMIPAGVMIVAWIMRKRWPEMATGLILFVIGLLPVLGLTAFLFQQFSTVADRYVYLPMLGICIAMIPLLQRWRNPIVLGAVLLIWSVLSFYQAGYWKNGVTLLTHARAINPRSVTVLSNLGQSQLRAQRPDLAEGSFLEAVNIDPLYPQANFNLAVIYLQRGDRLRAGEYRNRAQLAAATLVLRKDPNSKLALDAVREAEAALNRGK